MSLDPGSLHNTRPELFANLWSPGDGYDYSLSKDRNNELNKATANELYKKHFPEFSHYKAYVDARKAHARAAMPYVVHNTNTMTLAAAKREVYVNPSALHDPRPPANLKSATAHTAAIIQQVNDDNFDRAAFGKKWRLEMHAWDQASRDLIYRAWRAKRHQARLAYEKHTEARFTALREKGASLEEMEAEKTRLETVRKNILAKIVKERDEGVKYYRKEQARRIEEYKKWHAKWQGNWKTQFGVGAAMAFTRAEAEG
ncbi:hypothetical protein B0T19DRAFT_401594 [Cercophora scortea]|uniref:Uncharacterized protein n=1 Tax=Cercophora scortea TaxID=314031 RepID=A0AAE0IDT3_9PEZI|nr:hypothetical protein B0T19DRAFT_401594 [Cercophora scortea]